MQNPSQLPYPNKTALRDELVRDLSGPCAFCGTFVQWGVNSNVRIKDNALVLGCRDVEACNLREAVRNA